MNVLHRKQVLAPRDIYVSSFEEDEEQGFGIHVHTKPDMKKEKMLEEASSDQYEQKASLVRPGSPLRLEASVNSLVHFEDMLQPTTEMYTQVGREDKKILILAIIQYVITLEVSWDYVKSNVPEKLWDDLMKRRLEVVELE